MPVALKLSQEHLISSWMHVSTPCVRTGPGVPLHLHVDDMLDGLY